MSDHEKGQNNITTQLEEDSNNNNTDVVVVNVDEDQGKLGAVQQIHTDGTIDYVDAQAFGGDLHQMPPGYFYSVQFIGTVTVS